MSEIGKVDADETAGYLVIAGRLGCVGDFHGVFPVFIQSNNIITYKLHIGT